MARELPKIGRPSVMLLPARMLIIREQDFFHVNEGNSVLTVCLR